MCLFNAWVFKLLTDSSQNKHSFSKECFFLKWFLKEANVFPLWLQIEHLYVFLGVRKPNIVLQRNLTTAKTTKEQAQISALVNTVTCVRVEVERITAL